MKICRFLLICGLMILAGQAPAKADEAGQAGASKPDASWPFFAFCFAGHDAGKRTLPEQAEMLKKLGYAGSGHLWPAKADQGAETLAKAGLRLFQVYIKVDLAKSPSYDEDAVAAILPALKPHSTQLVLLIKGAGRSDRRLDDQAVAVIRRMADKARVHHVKIVLYPHTGDWLETSSDAVRLAKKVNRPGEVGVMFNLCHWMKADPNRDLAAVLRKARPWLMAVSLSGSDSPDEVRAGKGSWIQPLGQGSYNMGGFLDALRSIQYSGPVGLQCYGIRGDAQRHLQQSMEAWKRLTISHD